VVQLSQNWPFKKDIKFSEKNLFVVVLFGWMVSFRIEIWTFLKRWGKPLNWLFDVNEVFQGVLWNGIRFRRCDFNGNFGDTFNKFGKVVS